MEWLLGMTCSNLEDATVCVPYMGSKVIRDTHGDHVEAAGG